MHSDCERMDFYDLVLVVVKNLKFIVIGPLLAAGLAMVTMSLKPEYYKSEAVFQLQPDDQLRAASMLVSPQVLNGVIAQLDLNLTLAELSDSVSVSRNRDGLLRLAVTANSPLDAQKRAAAIVSGWMQNSLPSGAERLDLEKKLDQIREDYVNGLRLLEGLAFAKRDKTGNVISPDALSKLLEAEASYMAEMLRISKVLGGIPKASVIQQPTLPVEAVNPKTKLVVTAALLLAFGLSLLWVFLCHTWKTASHNPELAEKQAKLLAALRLGSR